VLLFDVSINDDDYNKPFGFRVRADVRDIRQTDGRTMDADDRLIPPPPYGAGA